MKKKRYIYKNHPEHKDTFVLVNEPDGYIINGLFYKDKDAVGNKVPRDIFIPIPVYFEPPDIIDVVGKCANCGVEFHIHKKEIEAGLANRSPAERGNDEG